MGLLVRSVALLVKASSLPSGLKTGSAARPLDCKPLGVALTSEVVAVVRSRMKMLVGKGPESDSHAWRLVGGVKSVPLVVRFVSSLVKATELPSGLKTAPELSP